MKLFAMLFLSVFLGKSCSGQTKNDLKNAVVEYTANTRSFNHKISIQNKMVTIYKDRKLDSKPVNKEISDADWKELVCYFENIKLDSLANLKAPTEKRFYDGAAIASLKIMYKDKIYKSMAFDHGFPPVAIKKLVDKINSFANN
jgi:hypothetical protein